MNKEIEKYYMGHINENHAEDFIKEALATGIRYDNVELVRLTTGKMPKQEAFYGYSSSLEFAIKEMASDEVVKVLVEAGCKLSKPYHYLTPFSGSPQKLMELWMKTNGKTKEEALQILANDISYFFHVIKTDYSCYRIPYEIDSEDKHKPCFWNYLDEWMSDFIKLLADESGLGITDSCFGRCIIENVELRKSFDTFFELSKQASDQDDLIWYINIAVNTDNEHAFAELIEYMPSLLKEVDCYPATSKKILSSIFDAGLLAPGTDEGFNAFIPFISYGKPDKDILCSIIHPSYSTRTIEDGGTPLMIAVENEDFPAELYKLLITSPDDINLQDGEGRTALHYMAETDYPECIEDLLDLGADPFIADEKGNNVLHILSENSGGFSLDVLGNCISLLPKELLTKENKSGRTPTDMLLKKLTGAGKETGGRCPFKQFLDQESSSLDKLNGNILIGGTINETRREILSLVKDHVIKQLASQEIEYEVITDKSPEETISLLEKLADGMDENNMPIFHLVVIDDLYDYQTLELGRRFEYAINRLVGNPDVLIIATSKLSSADIITDIIQRAFPYRITSMQTSAMNSKIFIDQYDAAYIGRNEVIIKGFEDELKLCTLGIEENEDGDANLRKKMLEEYKVFLEVERSWKKHMSAFREIAK